MKMEYLNWIWHTWLVVLFFINQTECIINGEIVEKKDINKFNYVVGIQIRYEEGGSLCGGAILDDYHILTAAHCLVKKSNYNEFPRKVKVRLHTLKNRDSMMVMKRYAQKLYLPTPFVRNTRERDKLENDIAVIRVKTTMNLAGNSRKLRKVELPRHDYPVDGDKGFFAGYGVHAFENENDFNSKPISDDRLRSLVLEVVPNNRCYSHTVQASRTCMCVKPYPVNTTVSQGVCSGDSGSPLVIKRNDNLIVIGVACSVEGGVDCDNRMASGYFTKVPRFANWISNIMKGTAEETDMTVVDMQYPTSCFW